MTDIEEEMWESEASRNWATSEAERLGKAYKDELTFEDIVNPPKEKEQMVDELYKRALEKSSEEMDKILEKARKEEE